MLKNILKKIINIFQWLLTVVLISIVLLLVFTAFNPIKSFQVLRVMSGSMEPAIKVGSVVFTQKVDPEILKKGEIITYISAEDPNVSITHRLVAVEKKNGETVFKTKGDANSIEDIAEISSFQIKGKVIFSLPFLGYLSVWIKKPLGFGLLVVLPALLIIISELLNIKKTIEKEVEKKYEESEKLHKNKPIDLLLIYFLLGFGLFQIKPINAYFSDVAVIGGSTFSATSNWSTPDVIGSVVINEIMWMGSTVHELDKWIELRNTTNEVIDITGWKLYGAGPGPNEIILNGKIEANGYFLLSHYASIDDKSALSHSLVVDQIDSSLHLTKSPGEQLILKDASGNIIDQTPMGSWVAGTHTSPATVEQSMERNSDLSSGWHTCTNIACNSTKYWDIEENNYGTPGYTNLSEEDLISSFSTQTVESESSSSPSPTPIPEVFPTPTLSPSPSPEPSPTILFENN